MLIVVVDYGVGNLGSILNMLRKVGASALVSSDAIDIERADKLVLPGVGAFDAGMANLHERRLVPVLNERVRERGTPVLGLCLGLQLFTRGSEEGRLPGLSWLDAETVRFRPPADGGPARVPHMGWNTVGLRGTPTLFDGLPTGESRFYFVHSYHVQCRDDRDIAGVTYHGYDFASAITCGNIMGTQFHPEKSHRFGARLMRNFVERC